MFKHFLPVFASFALLSGCSTITDWFDDEETLQPLVSIEKQYDVDAVWETTIGGGSQFYSRLIPVVAYDSVYSASKDGVITASELDSGEVKWQVTYPFDEKSSFWSFDKKTESVSISGGVSAAFSMIVFATENGDVVALDSETGDLKWEVNVAGSVLSQPALDANLVIVSTLNGHLIALDAASGEEKWRHTEEVPPLSLRGTSAPVSAGGGVFFGTAVGKLAVLLIENGQLAWDKSIASKKGRTELDRIADIDGKPLILGGVVYINSYDGVLAALELRSGRLLWKREYHSHQPLSVIGNTLYVVDKESVVYGVDRLTGVEKWSVSSLRGRGLTGAAEFENDIVVGDSYGYLHFLAPQTGELVSRYQVSSAPTGFAVSPVINNDIAYCQSRSGKLVAIKKK